MLRIFIFIFIIFFMNINFICAKQKKALFKGCPFYAGQVSYKYYSPMKRPKRLYKEHKIILGETGNSNVLGITKVKLGLKFDYKFKTYKIAPHKYCGALSSVVARFFFENFEVYYDNRYRIGSCPNLVIIRHENKHVEVAKRTFFKYRDQIEKLMYKTAMETGDVYSSGADGIKYQLSRKLNGVSRDIMLKVNLELSKKNRKIDSVTGYKSEQAKCSNWDID